MERDERAEREEVEPTPEPEEEPVDHHRGPLDRDEDGRFLDRDDPRRLEAEERLGKRFDPSDEGKSDEEIVESALREGRR